MKTPIDIETLRMAERLALMDELWKSLSKQPDQITLSPEHRAELDRRLDAIDGGDHSGVPWEEALRKIRAGR